MDRRSLAGIVQELRSYAGDLPAQVLELAQKLEERISGMTDEEVSMATDGVVHAPAAEQTYDANDINMIAVSLYDALQAHCADLRAQGGHEQLDSILVKLRGEVNTYERDFP